MSKEKISESVVKSRRALDGARHILKVITPISNDLKIILKSLEKVYESAILSISFILKYEHLKKRIKLNKEKSKNEEVFFNKCALRYGLNEKDITLIKELLFYGKRHKESGFEFSKRDRIIIMNDNLDTYEIDEKKIESFINSVEKLIISIENGLK